MPNLSFSLKGKQEALCLFAIHFYNLTVVSTQSNRERRRFPLWRELSLHFALLYNFIFIGWLGGVIHSSSVIDILTVDTGMAESSARYQQVS